MPFAVSITQGNKNEANYNLWLSRNPIYAPSIPRTPIYTANSHLYRELPSIPRTPIYAPSIPRTPIYAALMITIRSMFTSLRNFTMWITQWSRTAQVVEFSQAAIDVFFLRTEKTKFGSSSQAFDFNELKCNFQMYVTWENKVFTLPKVNTMCFL